MSTDVTHLISLGAGVQSSTMALMAAHGEIEPMPKAAIFADTQAEPPSVYEWLDWLETQLPFPVHRVTAGSLETSALQKVVSKKGHAYPKTAIPAFTEDAHGNRGKVTHRSCTRDFKIRPLVRAARKLGGIKRGQTEIGVIQWIGISLDELTRAKPARDAWCQHRFPLIERRMTRQACLGWMGENNYPSPPRSACYFCPFHSQQEWRQMQIDEPLEFDKAVAFERQLQQIKQHTDKSPSMPYLHRSCKPLDTIDFRSDVERGQQLLPGWQDECEGMCGI